MTELPPTPDEPRDVLGEDLFDDDLQVSDSFSTPDVHAVVAFALSLVSLAGMGVLNGTLFLYQSIAPGESIRSKNVLAALLGAAFALVPATLGWRASARVLDSDPRWVPTLARAAVIIALLSGFLRLVLAVLAASAQHPVSDFGSY
jgi:hypothetical protein